jgi:adenine-specific DNA-methyltransferase
MTPAGVQSKLRGGYYTPAPIAQVLADWAIRSGDYRVLEPSAGDGAFVEAVAHRLVDGHIDAVELYEAEASKIRDRVPGGTANVVAGDVFAWYTASRDGTYDAVVGNPPFVRYQTFPEGHRLGGFALMYTEGLQPNRLTNAWVPFVVLATRALKPGGRLAMVLPAELLQVTYAGELREYLARKYRELSVITFRRLVFDEIQQETVLLLGVRSESSTAASMSFLELDTADDLTRDTVAGAERVRVDLDHGREKWIQYYLSARELGLIRELERSDALTTLGALAEVDVGVVTGRNEFFVLTPSRAEALGVGEFCLPLVGRSAQIPGLVLRKGEWRELADADGRCLLLQLGRTHRDQLTAAALAYVEYGETAGYHTGYKCRIRLPEWWYVPSTNVPDAFLLRQIHDGPRIVLNNAGATCTDTIHRVRVKEGVDVGWLAAASMNSVTFAFSEIRGRSYGGGVLELEPNEADGLPFPRQSDALPLADLDLWARRKEASQILDEVDRLVLADCGMTRHEVATVRLIWQKLSARRMQRKRR